MKKNSLKNKILFYLPTFRKGCNRSDSENIFENNILNIESYDEKELVRFLEDNIGKIMSWANVLFLFLFSIHLFNFPDKFIILWCVFSIGVFWLQYKKLCDFLSY